MPVRVLLQARARGSSLRSDLSNSKNTSSSGCASFNSCRDILSKTSISVSVGGRPGPEAAFWAGAGGGGGGVLLTTGGGRRRRCRWRRRRFVVARGHRDECAGGERQCERSQRRAFGRTVEAFHSPGEGPSRSELRAREVSCSELIGRAVHLSTSETQLLCAVPANRRQISTNGADARSDCARRRPAFLVSRACAATRATCSTPRLHGRRPRLIVDCGAGTGRNLDWLREFGLAVGVERSPVGLRLGRDAAADASCKAR